MYDTCISVELHDTKLYVIVKNLIPLSLNSYEG